MCRHRFTHPAMLLLSGLLSLSGALQAKPKPEYRTALGDWGHFLSFSSIIYVNNPKGKNFRFALHQQMWVMLKWSPKSLEVRITGPDGTVVFDRDVAFSGHTAAADVKAKGKGVYKIELAPVKPGQFAGANVWFECSLPQSVIMAAAPRPDPATGKLRIEPSSAPRRHLYVQPSVPRRWWFWVPKGTKEFRCQAIRGGRHMSQREDWGIFIFSPRGQRTTALWGQPPVKHGRQDYEQVQTRRIQIEAGAAGRFWYVEIALGDAHNYSNINFGLEGVPPYLARSPEEWFDPETGKQAAVELYDDAKFMQAARDKAGLFQHWCPCPALGDPDGNMPRGDSRLALWNPENRELRFMVGDYLPRKVRGKVPAGNMKVRTSKGKILYQERSEVIHFHGDEMDKLRKFPRSVKGLCTVDLTGLKRFMFFTYPATPIMLVPQQVKGWRRHQLESATARNYYFLVPKKTKSFEVRARAHYDSDVIDLEVNAPDRIMARLYSREGTLEIKVPEGLDNKLWHLRLNVGSATRMITQPQSPRYLSMIVTLELKGVPGFLAPTWEQWFDPKKPLHPLRRVK